MAPEIVCNHPYGKQIDIWSLGIFLYELLHGYSAFRGANAISVAANIKKGRFRIEENISDEMKDLITGILRQHADERYTIEQIKNHRAFWIGHENYLAIPKLAFQQASSSLRNISAKKEVVPASCSTREIKHNAEIIDNIAILVSPTTNRVRPVRRKNKRQNSNLISSSKPYKVVSRRKISDLPSSLLKTPSKGRLLNSLSSKSPHIQDRDRRTCSLPKDCHNMQSQRYLISNSVEKKLSRQRSFVIIKRSARKLN